MPSLKQVWAGATGELEPYDIDHEEPTQELSRVNWLLKFFALGISTIGAVNFYYLSMAETPATADEPNPAQIDTFSRGVSVGFHELLYFAIIGTLLLEKLLRLPSALQQEFNPLSVQDKTGAAKVGQAILHGLGRLLLYYIYSLFAAMPTLSLVLASELSDTPHGWTIALLVLQELWLFSQVYDFFSGTISFWIMSHWRRQEQFYRTLERIAVLKDYIEGLSTSAEADQKELLKIIMGHTADARGYSQGLVQGSASAPLENNPNFLHKDAGWPEAKLHTTYLEVIQAIETMTSLLGLQQQEQPSCCQKFMAALQGVLKFLIGTAILIACFLYVIPQVSLAVIGMEAMPEAVERYLNPCLVDKDSWAIAFIWGLPIFFWNFIFEFLKGPFLKHLQIFKTDIQDIGWTFNIFRYVKALFSQHVLFLSSMVIGGFSVSPFVNIFLQSLKNLENEDLSWLAERARDLLHLIHFLHVPLAYFIGIFLVASTIHHIGKQCVNWMELKNWEDRPVRNLKTTAINFLDGLTGMLRSQQDFLRSEEQRAAEASADFVVPGNLPDRARYQQSALVMFVRKISSDLQAQALGSCSPGEYVA